MENRGQLKIFLGYAAGVGKTCAMLKAAQAASRRGVDVVAGYVEPHMQPETAGLLKGLEQLDALRIEENGAVLKEFDLDGAILRRPKLILVDELAHQNAAGCRHQKRYQDIEELLKEGIDVYTTVNVQHIESLNDMVASITGSSVRERIPDHVFDDASQVELVDIEPEELIERLNTGKLHRDEGETKTLESFFNKQNLTALREIALRRCADRMNRIADKAGSPEKSGYYTDEHILVCLSSSPTNSKIIRTAARMAGAFRGSFTALFVETPDFSVMREKDKERLRSNMRLAKQLGASIETVYGNDVAFQIAEFARLSGVSKLVMGRSSAQRKYFWSKASLTERLTNAAPNLDIYIIPDRETSAYTERKVKAARPRFTFIDIFKSLLMLAASTAIGFAFYHMGLSEANIIIVYILGILFTAIITSQKSYCLILSFLSVLTFNYFFTEPRYTLKAYDTDYPATFLIMFIAAFITGTLAAKIKLQAKHSAETAYRTKLLLETNQLLQKGREKNEIVSVTAGQLTKLLQRDIIFYLAGKDGLSEPAIFPSGEQEVPPEYTADEEKAVAAWALKNNKHAGSTTGTFGSARCLYLAVRVNSTVYGVVGIAVPGSPPDAFENSIMLSILGECALALENEKALYDREQAAILAKNEQLRANLLRAISHDLRTPLTSILGNAGVLLANDDTMDPEKKKELYSGIYDDSLWLINLVENLLSVTRIEDGSMNLKMNAELMDEVINEALHHINRRCVDHKITVTQSEDFILAKIEAKLIVQVLINIVDNAIKYTPDGSEIHIHTAKEGKDVVVTVADNGGGIPDEAKGKIFEMFYTENSKIADSRRSLGLGLALCKSIITAHGGEISVQDNQPQGTVFRFTLPAEEVALHE